MQHAGRRKSPSPTLPKNRRRPGPSSSASAQARPAPRRRENRSSQRAEQLPPAAETQCPESGWSNCRGVQRFRGHPGSIANGSGDLQLDLTGPEFRAITLAQFKAIREGNAQVLDEAVAALELVPCDTGELARLLQQTTADPCWIGAVYREGTLANWVRRDLKPCSVHSAMMRTAKPGKQSQAP